MGLGQHGPLMPGNPWRRGNPQRRICARPDCQREFTVNSPGHRQRFCTDNCSSVTKDRIRRARKALREFSRG